MFDAAGIHACVTDHHRAQRTECGINNGGQRTARSPAALHQHHNQPTISIQKPYREMGGTTKHNAWDTNDYDWDPSTLEAAARPRRTTTRPREGGSPEQEQQRVQRRQPFIGCQVHNHSVSASRLPTVGSCVNRRAAANRISGAAMRSAALTTSRSAARVRAAPPAAGTQIG